VRTLLAMTRDTLLMLRRRRLFWLHFWLNVAVVLLYASVAFADKGWSVGFGLKYTENAWLKHGTPWEHTMHCWLIARLMRWWVAGGGVLLALFGSAAILPETLEPGSAALLVPQARRRSLILVGRFLGSLGYMLLQTTLVVAGLWLVIRWRMGVWHHALWLGVPLATVLFVPLQAVAMFMGVLTRSATAALLVAILFAGSVWTVQESAAEPEPEPDPVAVAVAVDDHEDDSQGSGINEVFTHGALQQMAEVLPRCRDSMLWLEREACPKPEPKYGYRGLFRRLRVGHSGLSAVAADVIAAASVTSGKKPESPVEFQTLLISSSAFAVLIMALAAWLLKRRDL